jgi:predicted AAA+ superfamily ATPase
MPEYMQENLETKYVGEEIHPGETVEEKISLSERFGLWVSFYPFDQDEYLKIVSHWLKTLGCAQKDVDAAREEALSGRCSAARAAAALPISSPATGPGGECARSRGRG